MRAPSSASVWSLVSCPFEQDRGRCQAAVKDAACSCAHVRDSCCPSSAKCQRGHPPARGSLTRCWRSGASTGLKLSLFLARRGVSAHTVSRRKQGLSHPSLRPSVAASFGAACTGAQQAGHLGLPCGPRVPCAPPTAPQPDAGQALWPDGFSCCGCAACCAAPVCGNTLARKRCEAALGMGGTLGRPNGPLPTLLWPGPLQALAPLAALACGRQRGIAVSPHRRLPRIPAAQATSAAQHRHQTHSPATCPPQVLVPLAVLAQPSATPPPSSSAMAPWMGPSMGPPTMVPPGPPGQAYQCNGNGYNSGSSSNNNNSNDGGGSPLQCAPAQQRMLCTLPRALYTQLHAY